MINNFKPFDLRLKDFSNKHSTPIYIKKVSFNFKTYLYYIR